MVSPVQAVKREYQESNISGHPEAMTLSTQHGVSTKIEDHMEALLSEIPYVRYPTIQKHPDTEAAKQSVLKEYLCTFCGNLDKRRLENRFVELVTEWRREIGGLSSPRAITSHPAYQQILKMGETALPFIFQELQENGGWWYPALRTLTGQNPVPEGAKGRPPLSREAWLEWGRRNGYLRI